MNADFPYDVFLSHSSKDKAVVRPLAERLKKDGIKVWFDEWVLKPGDSIPAKIEEGLEHSRVLVLCMSAQAFGSDWAQLEAGTFRFRDPLNRERRFIPLRLDDAPIKGSLAQFLYINWLATDRENEYAQLRQNCQPLTKSSVTEPGISGEQEREEVHAETSSCKSRGYQAHWTFEDLPNRQTRAYHRQLCKQYVDLDSFDLLELCGKWRRLAKSFTNEACGAGRHGAHVVHDASVDQMTRLLETAGAVRQLSGIDRLGRCLRRPDDCHLHHALALLDDLEARLRAEEIVGIRDAGAGACSPYGDIEAVRSQPSHLVDVHVDMRAEEPENVLYPFIRASRSRRDASLVAGYAQATDSDLLVACNRMIDCLAGFDTVFLMSPQSATDQSRHIDEGWLQDFTNTHEMICLASIARQIDIESYKRLAHSAYTFWEHGASQGDIPADLELHFEPGISALFNLKRTLIVELARSRSTDIENRGDPCKTGSITTSS